MIDSLEDGPFEVRKPATYGFGVMALNGGQVYAKACADCDDSLSQSLPSRLIIGGNISRHTDVLPYLFKMISVSDSGITEYNTATENAISAVIKTLK
ncbi:unnamed protein product [Didymodactylos carnosus]|uniref:Uncharacterized protein n=1 Tax=Didymodactylos carnosus TaxID=1234261 RepID=A0A815YYW1_9BILA|nr:unnamed protein product [Didymodactylos carnosus]CAF1575992.1 unnamed protein product [Didymodactylos carnosus]CAF4147963.1 unnamed protein product [Didymodactylos carnosus]CAF4441192.1 unnamed protein product [Didymodactylos carnosus]